MLFVSIDFSLEKDSEEACLSFNKMSPKISDKIVTPMNNKVAAISKMMELPGDK